MKKMFTVERCPRHYTGIYTAQYYTFGHEVLYWQRQLNTKRLSFLRIQLPGVLHFVLFPEGLNYFRYKWVCPRLIKGYFAPTVRWEIGVEVRIFRCKLLHFGFAYSGSGFRTGAFWHSWRKDDTVALLCWRRLGLLVEAPVWLHERYIKREMEKEAAYYAEIEKGLEQ